MGMFRVIASCIIAIGMSGCGGGGGGGGGGNGSVGTGSDSSGNEVATPPTTSVPPTTSEPTNPSTSAPPTGLASVTLTWNPPTMNADGTSLALANLAGYYIAYGVQPDALSNIVRVDANVTATTVDGLAPATYYFAIKSITKNGEESAFTGAVSKTIQ